MRLIHHWHSDNGLLTNSNWDICGIAEREHGCIYIVADGSTSSPKGGEFARSVVCLLLEAFIESKKPPSKETLLENLEITHKKLCHEFAPDCVSYIVSIHNNDGSLHTLHAGDCRLGKFKQDQTIEWLTKAHTLANAITDLEDEKLAIHPDRHLLTRSFRGKRFQKPDYHYCVVKEKEKILLATDGFWAGLTSQEQIEFSQRETPANKKTNDDISCLYLEIDNSKIVESLEVKDKQCANKTNLIIV